MAIRQIHRFALALAAALVCAAAWALPEDDYRSGQKAYVSGDMIGAMAPLRRAADAGHAAAQALLAEILDRAELNEDAVAWYRKAAEQGYAAGEFGLGSMYFAGEGVPRDRSQALFWFTRAAERDHAPAIIELATALLNPPPQETPAEQAVLRWVRRAADLGHLPSMQRLAAAYRGGGLGIAPDAAQAALWEARVAETKKRQAGAPPKKKRPS